MDSKLKKIKDVLNLTLTVVLIICALVIISLLMINFFSSERWISKQEHKLTKNSSYHLPEVFDFKNSHDIKKIFEKVMKTPIRAFPLVIEYSSIISISNTRMLFIPVLIDEPQLQGIFLTTGIIDPLKWENPNQFAECRVGRRSMWFMPVGSTMIYGILIEPNLEKKKVGLGYVLVKRIDERNYDVLLKDNKGRILFAGRGELKKK